MRSVRVHRSSTGACGVIGQRSRRCHPSPARGIVPGIRDIGRLGRIRRSHGVVGRIDKVLAKHLGVRCGSVGTLHAAPASVVAVLKHVLVLAICKWCSTVGGREGREDVLWINQLAARFDLQNICESLAPSTTTAIAPTAAADR